MFYCHNNIYQTQKMVQIMLKNMIISLLSLFVMVVEVNAIEKENDCIFNNISNKTIKNWNQDDFCDALKNNSMLKHLLESNRVVKFSNAKCSTEVLNNPSCV